MLDEELTLPTSLFPLQDPVNCKECDGPAHKAIVQPDNVNGNAGRPYYVCKNPKCEAWVTWDDDKGMYVDNPQCKCGAPSREDMKGKEAKAKKVLGQGFWTCATGRCDYYSEDVEGRTWEVLKELGEPAEIFLSERAGRQAYSETVVRGDETLTQAMSGLGLAE